MSTARSSCDHGKAGLPAFRFERLRPGPLGAVSLEAVRTIRSAIDAGAYPAGSRLPSERQLASMLGISRPSLRDALKVLTGMGLVSIRRGSGVFVSPPAAGVVIVGHDGKGRTPRSSRSGAQQTPGRNIADLFELRAVLEVAAARWAAERGSARQIRAIAEMFQRFSACATADALSIPDADAHDAAVHELIARATGNAALVRTLLDLREAVDANRHREDILVPQRLAKNLVELGDVVDALKQRDADRAAAAMRQHIVSGAASHRRKRRRRHPVPDKVSA